ncbi:uncharacterized protein isoform X2 [Rhodnius prolixus]|uniref:uncharacterized protein isoform X2 n=1 Tax=Rhodnius prolixus TaxID=13249 RepID=UPI003D188392
MSAYFMQRIRSLLQHYNRYSDEVTEKLIIKEYYHFLKLSLFYPSLKSPITAGIHLLQFIIYVVVLGIQNVLGIISIIKSNPEDFLLVMNIGQFGLLSTLLMLIIIMFNATRYEFCMSHKMIGDGVYTYEGEEVPSDDYLLMTMKYKSIKRKLMITHLCINLSVAPVILLIKPWMDEKYGSENLRTYTNSGFNTILPLAGWYPFDTHQGLYFYLALLEQAFCGYIIIIIVASFVSYYFTSTIQIIIQLERLILSIKNLNERAISLYKKTVLTASTDNFRGCKIFEDDPVFMECLKFCFRQNIQHHQQILRLIRLVNTVWKVPLFSSFLAEGIVLGISAMVVIFGAERPGVALGTLSIAVAELVNITTVCKLAQTITDLNEKLHLITYDIPWYQFSRNLQRSVCIVQEMTCQELCLEGLFNTKANMETYSKVSTTDVERSLFILHSFAFKIA